MVKMNREKAIEKILGFMHHFMHSIRTQDFHPWMRLELTKEQLRVIFLLFHKGELSPGEIARVFGVPKTNVTNVINRLVTKGLLNRCEDPADRRRCLLSLTDEGKNRVIRLREISTAQIRRVLERMPDDALNSLVNGLGALMKALGEEGQINGSD